VASNPALLHPAFRALAGVISGVILAAGTSSRLGRPKQLLELEGRPLLQHVLDAASASGLDEVVVVLGHDSERIASTLALPPGTRVVVNHDYSAGQSTSLRAGLDSVDPRADAAAILLGDQPRLPPSAIRKALDAFRSSEAPIMRALWRGTPGHPVVLARSEWESVRKLRGDKGARDLVAASARVDVIEMSEPPVEDVDTWEQYETLRGHSP
jgi:molybdenum cofactor cytidylyltransferase